MIEIGGYRMHKCDERNWCIDTKRTVKDGDKKGEEVWGNRKYYPRLEHASLSLFDILVSNADVNDVSSLIAAIQTAKEEIVAAVASR